MAVDLAPTNAYGLELRAPVLVAAGCLGFGGEYLRLGALAGVGALVTGGVALRGRRGSPRLIETPGGLVCAGGWSAVGVDRLLRDHAPGWAAMPCPVILNVIADHAQVAAAVEGIEGLAGLELSLDTPALAARVVASVRAATLLPLLVKLPLHDALAATASAVLAAGADALTVAAPPAVLVTDPASGELVPGWLCGPATRGLALRAVAELRAAVEAPIVACGGIAAAADARPALAAGAQAVQVGSALLADPWAAARCAAELEQP